MIRAFHYAGFVGVLFIHCLISMSMIIFRYDLKMIVNPDGHYENPFIKLYIRVFEGLYVN
jgi:hypothetical protein